MAGKSIRAILARAMIRYSPELITWRADVRVKYCDGYSNMIVTNVKLQPSDATPRSASLAHHFDSSNGQRAGGSRTPYRSKISRGFSTRISFRLSSVTP